MSSAAHCAPARRCPRTGQSWLPALPGGAVLVRVPPAMVVVLGDNPCSEDSRRYGCVPEASVIAMIHADCRIAPS